MPWPIPRGQYSTVHRDPTAKPPGLKPKFHHTVVETLGKSLNFSEPQLPICKMEMIIII